MLFSLIISFHQWDILNPVKPYVGTRNYQEIATIYPPFWPALLHNLIWLAFLLFIATPFGMFLAVLLDRELRGARFYQSAFFLPVVLSLAVTAAKRRNGSIATRGPKVMATILLLSGFGND